MSTEALKAIDKQIVNWIEQLDDLYKERLKMTRRIGDIEERLSSMKVARRSLAVEWGDSSEEISIPLQYTSEGVREAIHEIFEEPDEELTVPEIVMRLKREKYDFGDKNPRRVVNMALVNDPNIESDGTGKYSEILEDIPF